MHDLTIGVAGIGAIANEYLSLFAEGKITGGHIAALSSRDPQKLQAAAERYGLAPSACYTDYEQMLDTAGLDAVIICTPHGHHPHMAVSAINRGIHPLIEKPLGGSRAEASEILSTLVQHPEVRSGVLYCRRMSPIYRRVKELMTAGAIGSLKRACWQITNLYRTDFYHRSAPWRGTWTGECGGLLMTQASHQLDLLLWLTGMPESVYGFCASKDRPIEVENEAMLQLTYPGGATGQFIASSCEYPGTNRLELCGNLGQLIVEDDKHLILRVLTESEHLFAHTAQTTSGPIPLHEQIEEYPEIDNRTQQAAILNDFVQACTQNRQTVCPANEGLWSLAVINAAYLSSWQKQEIPLSFDDADYLRQLHRHQSPLDV